MTRKFTHPRSTFTRAGSITRRQQLSFDKGVLQMTLNIFRDRVIGGKPMTDRDVQVLENSMRAYGEICVREHKGAGAAKAFEHR